MKNLFGITYIILYGLYLTVISAIGQAYTEILIFIHRLIFALVAFVVIIIALLTGKTKMIFSIKPITARPLP